MNTLSATPLISSVRFASRQLVRSFGMLTDKCLDLPVTHTECHVLIELEAAGGASPLELAKRLDLEKSTISRIIASLRRKRWIVVQAGATDKRQKLLNLTAAGRRTLAGIHQRANAQVLQSLALLSAEDQRVVNKGLSLYSKALTTIGAQINHTIRPIQKRDNPQVAHIIRSVMTELGASGPGFSIHDREVDSMYQHYRGRRSSYFVVTKRNRIVGCGGIAPLQQGNPNTCELRKMYFLPEARGLGLGKLLLTKLLQEAKRRRFSRCYLETTPKMKAAQGLYLSFGFKKLSRPKGATGHCGCTVWMERKC